MFKVASKYTDLLLVTASYESFGKYVLLEKLATGGMAEIFLARGTGAAGVGKFFAIKRILPQYADTPEFKDMFQDEAKIAINLKHSNIVSLHEFGIEKGQFYIVMDYVEGRNLRQILSKMKKTGGAFNIEEIVYVIKEVAAGLEYAHRCIDESKGKPLNIIHRDMSPQNVMVSFEGEVKIVDFGIAKAENQLETTRAGTLKGKFGYMSPEQAEGQPVDLRTDIFSLGIVLWELLANDRLFQANSEIQILKRIRDCQIPSLRRQNPNIKSELERITQKALARDRNLRYQTSSALHRDLNRFLNREYPEFSSQDFAVSVKNIFQDEIMNQRKRMVEYANVNLNVSLTIPTLDPSEQVRLLSTQTGSSLVVTDSLNPVDLQNSSGEATPRAKSDLLDNASRESEISELTPTSPSQSEAKVKFKLQIGDTGPDEPEKPAGPAKPAVILDENALATATASAHNLRVKGKIQPRDTKPDSGNEEPTKTTPELTATEVSRPASNNEAPPVQEVRSESVKIEAPRPTPPRSARPPMSRPATNPRIPAPAGEAANPMRFATLGVFGFICLVIYSYLVANHPAMMTPVVRVTNPVLSPLHTLVGFREPEVPRVPTTPPKPVVDPLEPTKDPVRVPATPTPAPEPFADLMVNSSPSGAEILLNDKLMGQTPFKVKVPTDRKFSIVVRKRGYEDFKKENIEFAQLGSPRPRIEPTLKKMNIAFLDVEIDPPQAAELYVNDRRVDLTDNAARDLMIPGDTTVRVRAESTSGQSFDEVTVRVGTDNRRSIKLNPRKNPKRPGKASKP